MTEESFEIVIIGAGRLATHLGLAFFRKGLKVAQVYNRTADKGQKLAKKLGASFINDLSEVTLSADLYFLAVSDSVLEDLSSRLRLRDKLVVHSSGTMGMEILTPISSNIGVFYPVQTFSHNKRINFRKVPVCIEGNTKFSVEQLEILAGKITDSVHYLNSDKRRILHLGAVFASNFTNFLYAVTEELLLAHDIPLTFRESLILKTAMNVRQGKLITSQTGPAVRGDDKVLDKHRMMLADHPEYLAIYNLISDNIIKHKLLHGKL